MVKSIRNTSYMRMPGCTISVGSSGNIAALGRSHVNNGRGEVRIYVQQLGQWILRDTIVPPDIEDNDGFGYSISLSQHGDMLIASSPRKKSMKGAAYVFKYLDNIWHQDAMLYPVDFEESFMFGKSLTVSEDMEYIALSGSYGKDKLPAVYIYRKDMNFWMNKDRIVENNSKNDPRFGESLSFTSDGKTLMVSSPGYNKRAGRVYQYSISKYGSSLSDIIDNTEFKPFIPLYGYNINISGSGNFLAIGCPGKDMLRGEVIIYERVNAKWVHHSTIENNHNRYLSYFGFYVALETEGDILRVGFYDKDNIAYTRLYKRELHDWIPFKRFKFDVKNLEVSEMETPF